jgi:uracil phosphoribosyltransferase
MAKTMAIRIVEHPLARHLITHLRDKTTKPALFRTITKHLTTILVLEATRDVPLDFHTVETPLETMEGDILAQQLVVIPVLRAGLGMLEPITEMFPYVSVGYIGLARDEETAIAASYYCKLPDLKDRLVLIVDPMLATGGSASQAITLVKEAGGEDVRLVCVVAAPEGVNRVNEDHPDVPIYGAAFDRELNEKKYILPGLGDFGDRLFGTP